MLISKVREVSKRKRSVSRHQDLWDTTGSGFTLFRESVFLESTNQTDDWFSKRCKILMEGKRGAAVNEIGDWRKMPPRA